MRKIALLLILTSLFACKKKSGTSAPVVSAPTISTIAGNGTAVYSGDGGLATAAGMNPGNIAMDKEGNLYICDRMRVRKVNTSGVITTIAGNNVSGFSGDGGPAVSASLQSPVGIAIDNGGNIYIVDDISCRVRKINTTGIITTVAGNGAQISAGDGGPATNASFMSPSNIAIDGNDNLYITDYSADCIRKIDAAGIITTVAGTGTPGYSGDGGPATTAQLHGPEGIAIDGSNNVYVADDINFCIRKIDASGYISTIAGNHMAGYSGDGAIATSAMLNYPNNVTVDDSGNIYICDGQNNRIRKVNTTGIITTVAGNGIKGYSGDRGPATAAELNLPAAALLDVSHNIYFTDLYNNVVRKISNH